MSIKVLVVDDDRLITRALSTYLLKRGYEVTATTSPETALSLIQRTRFDAIISDLMMEPVTGIELVRRLRGVDSDCKVIIISGSAEWENIAPQVEGLNVSGFLEKPFELEQVHRKLSECLRRWS